MQDFAPSTFSGTDLACRRGGRVVFAGLAFGLKSGEALVLRGANGSGKSSLLRIMAGLGRRLRGELAWNGERVTDTETHCKNLRFVGHLDAIKPALTVAENLSFWRDLWGDGQSGGGQSDAVAAAALALELDAFASFPARLLSAGQRHRLALARLVLTPAPLWLLDEPGNALDERSLAALTRVIAAHRKAGGMVVMASHGAAGMDDVLTLNLDAFAAPAQAHWSEDQWSDAL